MAYDRGHITNNTDITFEQTYIHFEKRFKCLKEFEEKYEIRHEIKTLKN